MSCWQLLPKTAAGGVWPEKTNSPERTIIFENQERVYCVGENLCQKCEQIQRQWKNSSTSYWNLYWWSRNFFFQFNLVNCIRFSTWGSPNANWITQFNQINPDFLVNCLILIPTLLNPDSSTQQLSSNPGWSETIKTYNSQLHAKCWRNGTMMKTVFVLLHLQLPTH